MIVAGNHAVAIDFVPGRQRKNSEFAQGRITCTAVECERKTTLQQSLETLGTENLGYLYNWRMQHSIRHR